MERSHSINPKELNIGFLNPYALTEQGGVQQSIMQRREYLENAGHNVSVFTPVHKGRIPDGNVIPLGRGVGISIEGTRAVAGLIPVCPRKISQEVNDRNFNVLHLDEPEVNFPALQALWGSDAPTRIATFHVVKERVLRYKLWGFVTAKLFGGKLTACTAVSEAARDYMRNYLPGHYDIIPNGVDTKRFSPDQPKVKKFVDGKTNILYVGRLEKRKGVEYLVDAFGRLKPDYEDTRLIIVGGGPEEEALRKQSQGTNDIEFVGKVSGELLPNYYSTADIFCSPAYTGESFGIVLLEAMSARLPIVAGNNVGYRAVIKEGVNGFLANVKSTDELCRRLEELIINPAKRKKIGEQGRQTAVEQYDLQVVGKKWLDYYLEKLQPVMSGRGERT